MARGLNPTAYAPVLSHYPDKLLRRCTRPASQTDLDRKREIDEWRISRIAERPNAAQAIALSKGTTFPARIEAAPFSSARGLFGLRMQTLRLFHAQCVEGGEGARIMQQQGIVKFFNTEKGYGFIKPADGGRDIFVHISAVEAAGLTVLPEGAAIAFEIEPDKKGKGPKAVNLQLETP